jgi:O-antigen ligase
MLSAQRHAIVDRGQSMTCRWSREKSVQAVASATAIALLFALLPPVAAGGAMALPVFVCLAGAASVRPSLLRQVFEKKTWPLWLLAAFVAWVIASSLWSDYPESVQAQKLAILVPLGLMFAGAASAEPTRRLTQAAGAAAFIVLAVLLTIEALWDLPLNRAANPEIPPGEVVRNVNRAAAVLLAVTWGPAAYLLANGRARAAWAVLAVSGLLALPFDLWANVAAFMLGLAAFALAFSAPRLAVMAASGAWALWVLVAPFVTPLVIANKGLVDALPESWAQRAGIWNYVCARILEQPWIGHGLDASRAVTDRIEVRGVDMRGVSLHPHSASLQIWFETGAVGAVLAASALLAGGWAAARAFENNRPAAAAAAATLASLGVIANLSFGAWQEWWDATLIVAAALVGALSLRRG